MCLIVQILRNKVPAIFKIVEILNTNSSTIYKSYAPSEYVSKINISYRKTFLIHTIHYWFFKNLLHFNKYIGWSHFSKATLKISVKLKIYPISKFKHSKTNALLKWHIRIYPHHSFLNLHEVSHSWPLSTTSLHSIPNFE